LMVNQGQVVADGAPIDVLRDQQRLRDNRLVPTSLLQANLDFYSMTQRFYSAESLAHRVKLTE